MSDTSRRKRTRNPARFDRSLDGAILSAVLEGLAERGYDRMSMDESLAGPEALEGFLAFKERRQPAWVPEDLRTEGRL